jgi:hypothetical protein
MPGKFLGLAALAFVLAGCPPQTIVPACGPSTCAGCCDALNVCQLGTSANTCGSAGNACDVCVGSQVCGATATGTRCSDGAGGGSGGGGGGGGGSGVGGGSAAGGGMGGGSGGGSSGPRTITGTRTFTSILETGSKTEVVDVSGSILKAHSEIDGGQFVSLTGTGTADGGFSIAGVPAGPYYFQYRDFYFLTQEDVLHLTTTDMGRKTQRLAPSPTMLTINATGLAPWVANDKVSMSITNIAMLFEGITSLGAAMPAPGATAAPLTFNYAQGTPHGLIEASAGDRLVLTQNQTFNTPVKYQSATTGATVTDLNQSPGLASSVNALFAPLPLTMLNLNWQTTLFEPLAATIHPTATVAGHRLTAFGVAGQTPSTGVNGTTHQLLTMVAPAGGPNVAGVAQLGNPFSSSVVLNAKYENLFTMPVQAPAAASTPLLVGFIRSGPVTALTGPIVPGLGAPRNVTVNGVAATPPLTGIGTSPVISWTAPAFGTPDRYVLNVLQLTNVAGQTQIASGGQVALKGTQVRMPPGLLTAGRTYVLIISSTIVGGTTDVERNPYAQSGSVFESTDTVIGPITP